MAELGQDLDALVVEEKKDYDAAVEASAKKADTEVELGMRAVFVHGDEVIADAAADGGFLPACAKFKSWVNEKWPKTLEMAA